MGLLALTSLAAAQKTRTAPPPPGRQQSQSDLYHDPAEFPKLSGAAQNLLTAKFGPLVQLDEKGNPIVEVPPGSVLFPVKGKNAQGHQLEDPGVVNVLGNVLVNNAAADATSQDTQSETALVLGAGTNIIAAFNDSGSFLGASAFTGWAFSTDDGATWTDPGALPGGNDAGDPVLTRDDTLGRTYLIALFFNGSGINVFRSDNDGAAWMAPVNGTPGMAGFQDKPWIACDNFPGAGNGNLYLVTRDFGGANGIFLFRSTDDGATFGPNGGTLIASAGASNVQGAYVVVGPDHSVYAFWYDSNVVPAEIRMRKSTDFGVTFGPNITVTQLVSNVTNGNLSLVAGFRSNSFPIAAVNPVTGQLYVAYNDPVLVVGGDRGNILLRRSSDGGLTWSPPQMVNDDGTARAQYFPAIAVRPDGTGLCVGWYDNRNSATDTLIERWSSTATIAGGNVTFGPNFRVSPQFPPVFGVDPVVNTVYMGDYDQMAADNSLYYTTWGDNRDQSIASPGRKNANVRFTSFGPEGPGAIIDLFEVTVGGGNLNGRIDANECGDLIVTLSNSGGQPATGVSAVLSTATPDVTIFDALQFYPDLLPGEEQANTQPYRVSTSPAFACGSTIDFVLTVTSSEGVGPIPFSITTGGSNYVVQVDAGPIVPGTTNIGNFGDDVVTAIALPFPVAFYSSVFNAASVSSNGNVQFTSGSATFSNPCLPDLFHNNVIAAHWDDLRTDGFGSGIFTSTTGVAPNREFHIEWRTTYFSGGGTANFELRLHENSSSFELVFGNLGQGAASATIGCQQGTGPNATQFSCNVAGSVSNGTILSFSLPGCPDGGGECIGGPACHELDFETEDDFATPLANGQQIDTEFGALVTITSSGANNGAGIFDTDPAGPNNPSQDVDLLVNRGNVLILQNNLAPAPIGGFFPRPNDDENGGSLIFDLTDPGTPQSVVLIDIDTGAAQGSSVVLTDFNGLTRTYTVPAMWTEDIILNGGTGWRTLDLTTLAPQPGFASVATASEQPGFDATQVVRIRVNLGSSGAVDDLSFCE